MNPNVPVLTLDEFEMTLIMAVEDYKKCVSDSLPSTKHYGARRECAEWAARRWLLHNQLALRMAHAYPLGFIAAIEILRNSLSNRNDPTVGQFAAGRGEMVVDVIMALGKTGESKITESKAEELVKIAYMEFAASATVADMILKAKDD